MRSKEALLEQISASSVAQLSTPLPKIEYNNSRLKEIIEDVLLSDKHAKEVTEYLDTIGKEVEKLKKYQAKTNPSDFYEMMKVSISEIHNTTNEIYKIINKYPKQEHVANKIRNLVKDIFYPFEKELNHRLAMPKDARNELELKTKRLYAQQSYVARSTKIQESLMRHLNEISILLKESDKPSPRCYISYAWPSLENKEKEYWVQPFLYILYDHLKAAGIDIVMDIRDSKVGDNIYRFMNQYNDGNYIITVGTESLLQKHLGMTTAAVQTELNIALKRNDDDKKLGRGGRICPLLISGTIEESFPDGYRMYRNIQDGRGGEDSEISYLELIEELLEWLHHNQINNSHDLKLKEAYVNKWRDFYNHYKAQNGLTNNANVAEIEVELKLELHKQRLGYLRQDLKYQALEVQEKTEFSAATNTKIVGALMESNGISPQNLWDAAGRQYQRPQINPNQDADELKVLGVLEKVIASLLVKAEAYINSNREPDKRILLETYGFALALSYHIPDFEEKEKIERNIIKSLKEFAFEDLRLVNDIELSSLAGNRRDFKEAFENIRLKNNASRINGQNIQQSLKAIDSSFKEVIRSIFKYLHSMLGKPPIDCKYAAVCVGSLATQMTTPYSDVEYIILVDKHSDANRVYFTNFADLFELLMISFGESPIYKAEEFLKDYKPYFKYIKNGARVILP